jgi:hypothetical protein
MFPVCNSLENCHVYHKKSILGKSVLFIYVYNCCLNILFLDFSSEDGDRRFLWNVDNDLPEYVVSHPQDSIHSHHCENIKYCTKYTSSEMYE